MDLDRVELDVRPARVGPARGVYHAGSHAHPGPRLEQIGMATAAVAAHIGAAPR